MKPHQLRSAGITLLIHGVILALLMFLYISSPIPPWEEGLAGGGGGGSFVEFGTLDIEQGPVTTPTPAPAETTPQEDDENLMTSEVEETVAIDQPEKNDPKKKEKKEVKKPEVKKSTTTVAVNTKPELPKVETPKVDPRSLYPGKKGTGGSPTGTQAGNGTGGSGNGNGGGNGDGTGPGTGTGTGGGNGSGNGPGNGIGFDLAGRNFRSLPRLEDRSQEQGKVVIDIVVDKAGNVVRAEGPGRGSTLTNGTLVRKCREAAMKAKFSASPAGVEEQKGSITFNFILR
jgi:outer membrane biosynthesis protein TonB